MKRINPWLMLFLNIITVGIYGVVWMCLRRNEMVRKFNQPIPHWLWIVLPPIIYTVAYIAYYAITADLAFMFSEEAPLFTVVDIVVLPISFVIGIWWAIKFARATKNVTRGRLTTGWVVVWGFFGGILFSPVLQHYFNQVPQDGNALDQLMVSKSKKFIAVNIAAIVLTVLMIAVLAVIVIAAEDFVKQIEETEKLEAKANSLTTKYSQCSAELEAAFPGELMPEQEADYNAGYSQCESILEEQHAATDEYNRRIVE